MDGLSQLSDELEEETAFLFAARGAAFGFFAGFFFLVPFFFFFGTGAASVRPTKEAMLASESPASPSKQLGFTRKFTHGLAISVVRFQTSVQGAPFISFHYTASLLSCFFPGGPFPQNHMLDARPLVRPAHETRGLERVLAPPSTP